MGIFLQSDGMNLPSRRSMVTVDPIKNQAVAIGTNGNPTHCRLSTPSFFSLTFGQSGTDTRRIYISPPVFLSRTGRTTVPVVLPLPLVPFSWIPLVYTLSCTLRNPVVGPAPASDVRVGLKCAYSFGASRAMPIKLRQIRPNKSFHGGSWKFNPHSSKQR